MDNPEKVVKGDWRYQRGNENLYIEEVQTNKDNGKITLSPWKKQMKDEDTIIYTTSKLAKQAVPGL
jgi:hypothetical protein